MNEITTRQINILYVGAIERGFFIEEYAARHDNVTFDQEQPELKIDKQINAILRHEKQDYTVFDVAQYADEPDIIAERINGICASNNSKAIILASGWVAKSDLLVALRESGIRYFILKTDVRGMVDELEKCMNGWFDANEQLEIQLATEEKREVAKKIAASRYIGIAGCCNRIGTTTHAIQIVKYLMGKGYSAAYIQMNSTNYIRSMRSWLALTETESDKEIGLLRYDSVDHFYKTEKIPDVLKLGYDFYVYDYGTCFDPNFNRLSFSEKDFRIFVVGSDPSELSSTYEVVKSSFYDEVKYIFNFVNEKDAPDVYELMEYKKTDTYLCTKYIADKYVLSDTTIYDKIINVEQKEEAETTKKKRGWSRGGSRR